MRLATPPACCVLSLVLASMSFCSMLPLLNILKTLPCAVRWQLQGRAARDLQLQRVEGGRDVLCLSPCNFSHAPKLKMWKTLILRHCLAAAHLWHSWSRLGAALTCAIPNSPWGCSLVHPKASEARCRATSIWQLCCLYGTALPTGNPRQTH